jgi:tRNA threonylcarbamoyladenosine modification (KEOPS) complex  Pcc1 subunit
MIKCLATFDLDSEVAAKAVVESIKPDMEFEKQSKRSDVKMERKGKKISLEIRSTDVPAFRSAINTYSKLIQVSGGLMKNG